MLPANLHTVYVSARFYLRLYQCIAGYKPKQVLCRLWSIVAPGEYGIVSEGAFVGSLYKKGPLQSCVSQRSATSRLQEAAAIIMHRR